MTDWEHISRLFRDALPPDPSALGAFLDKVCGSDLELRQGIGLLFEPRLRPVSPASPSEWRIAGLDSVLDELDLEVDEVADTAASIQHDGYKNPAPFKLSPFSMLDTRTLGDLLSVMHLKEYSAGEHLIREGDPAEF